MVIIQMAYATCRRLALQLALTDDYGNYGNATYHKVRWTPWWISDHGADSVVADMVGQKRPQEQ